jgi:hypothetical protein
MVVGTLAYRALVTMIQTLIILAIAFASGARFDGGVVTLCRCRFSRRESWTPA